MTIAVTAAVGQVWTSRGHPYMTLTVTAVDGGIIDTDRGRRSVHALLRHWELTGLDETKAVDTPTPSDLNVDAAHVLLTRLGFEVTDDLERDIDRAIDVERQRAEHGRLLVALVLGHSVDYARTMGRAQVLGSVRDAVLDRDRCDTCPWAEFGRAIECGGAAGICPGNTRPTVDDFLEQYPEPTP